jgi:hypothetical protein
MLGTSDRSQRIESDLPSVTSCQQVSLGNVGVPQTQKRSAETEAAPPAPPRGSTEQHKARRSLSGARSKYCLCTLRAWSSNWRFRRKQKLDARASFKLLSLPLSRGVSQSPHSIGMLTAGTGPGTPASIQTSGCAKQLLPRWRIPGGELTKPQTRTLGSVLRASGGRRPVLVDRSPYRQWGHRTPQIASNGTPAQTFHLVKPVANQRVCLRTGRSQGCGRAVARLWQSCGRAVAGTS